MGKMGKRATAPRERQATGFAPDPLWYKDAIIYELHVRAFADSNDDGITIPNHTSLDINPSGFTVEFWMRGIDAPLVTPGRKTTSLRP